MRRTQWMVAACAVAALAVVVVIGTGCSHAPASGTNSSGSAHEEAMKFAECMRNNGISQFPDPSPSGGFTIDAIANGSSLDTSSAAFKQALGECKDLEPAGFTGQKRSAELQQAALKFAQCVRDNGVKDFPDPTPDGPLIDTNRIPSAATSAGMSALNAATSKCGEYAQAAGVAGDR